MESLKFKIVMLGDQSVGKTSIINRLIFDSFTGNEQSTVGVDFVTKTIVVGNKNIRLQLWDTAGQQRFHSLIPGYIKDSKAAIIVFDITSQSSYLSLNKWISNVREERGEQANIFVLGNKTDLEEQRAVKITDAEKKLSQEGINYMEVSAKSGTNILQFFKSLSDTLLGNDTDKGQAPKKQAIKISVGDSTKPKTQVEKKRCSC